MTRTLVVMLLTITGSVCTVAQNAIFVESEVQFHNGEVVLSGTLIVPRTEGPSPAVVFLHGSGPATRAGARDYAIAFAKLGIASLFYDKRGSGSSGGSWLTASLNDLSNDALAGVEYLKAQRAIDPKRIGFWGVSQAGWVATLAASQSSDIAFMVLISAGGASPRESELFSYRTTFQKAGLSEAETTDGLRVIGMYFEYLRTGQNRTQLVTELKNSKNKAWYKYASLDRILPSEENRVNWSWVSSWDPAPHIDKITCPMLLMFGDKDTDHPTALALEKWREGLQQAGNTKAVIMTFPGAGHGIRMREGFIGQGRPPFADGYAEAMLGWLWMHVANAGK